MTILLSGSERKQFEFVYESLRMYPDWQMENIFVGDSSERKEFERCSRFFYRGAVKPNRLIVAAHEAGHCVVLAATRGHVAEAKIDIKNHPKGWIGFVKRTGEGLSDSQPMEQKPPCVPAIRIDLLVMAAGFIGESFVGRERGAEHEKFLIYCMTRFLDEVSGAEPLENWAYYVNWCRNIILNNESLFWRVTDDLLKNSELSIEIKTLLHNQIKKEPATKFFYEEIK